jgi:hypothetical protein
MEASGERCTAPSFYSRRNINNTFRMWGWVGPKAGLDVSENSLFPAEIRIPNGT